MDDKEREAIRAEGLDPDDPALVAALDRVNTERAARAAAAREIPRSVRKVLRCAGSAHLC
jgi:hypothetical protein